jgi:hypothetical protein
MPLRNDVATSMTVKGQVDPISVAVPAEAASDPIWNHLIVRMLSDWKPGLTVKRSKTTPECKYYASGTWRSTRKG